MTPRERADLCSQLSLEPSSVVSLADSPDDLDPWHFLVLRVDPELDELLLLRLTDGYPGRARAGGTQVEQLEDMLDDLAGDKAGLAWRRL